MSGPNVVVVNTLGGALAHYTRGLVECLVREGASVSLETVQEPSVAGGSGTAWLGRYIGALLSARRTARSNGAHVLVTWPVLGHLDRLLIRVLLGSAVDASLIMHDPRPLVHARGYSEHARRLGALARQVRMIVHSETARAVLADECPGAVPGLLPHPVVPRATRRRSRAAERPVVRVLGQYKPDRDLAMLAALGRELGDSHRLEVIGRKWPAIDGWTVTDEFVSEERLDELMASADAILVPYRRFFQSGIAIRSLELGTPAVGPAGSSISELYPDDRFLAEDCVASWRDAIRAAVNTTSSDLIELAAQADARCRHAWGRWIRRSARHRDQTVTIENLTC